MQTIYGFAALAVTALALQALPAKAQDSTSSSGSTSSSSSSSGSLSGSRSGASTTSGTSSNQQRSQQRVNTTTNNNIPITFNSDPGGGGGAGGGSGGGAGNGSLTPGGSTGQPYYGQSDVTIRSAPPVYAPNVQGGNPCTVGYSVGVSWIGAGVAGGMSTVDEDCANRQKIAMIHNAGRPDVAFELMCNDRATYNAAKLAGGKQCAPRPQFDGPGAPAPPPIVQQQPVPLAPPPQQVIVRDRSNLPRCSRTITDNCWAG